MEKDKYKQWLKKIINSSYLVKKYDQNGNEKLLLYYDEKIIRFNKIKELFGNDLSIPIKYDGVCLFELDLKNNYILYDQSKIYYHLYNNYYTNNIQHINCLIKDILFEYVDKKYILTKSNDGVIINFDKFYDIKNFSILTPTLSNWYIVNNYCE